MLHQTLRLTIVGTIAIVALICLVLSYQAMFDTICGQWHGAATRMFWGTTCGISALLLIKYRDDLIDM